MKKANILIVDDDPAVRASLRLLIKQLGFVSKQAEDAQSALDRLSDDRFDLVLQDMNFSARQTTGEEGLALLKEIKSQYPNIPVILMTAWGSIALAVTGVQAGASDFITKPWTHQQLSQTINTALSLKESKEVANAGSEAGTGSLSREGLEQQYDFSHIIGEDPKLLKILQIIGRVSQTDAPILVTGESGTGKELIAEAIHKNSPRKEGPMVRVNLGSIPASLFESELFGHKKGAFTDAKSDREGRFSIADGGTIFLDEIGDLDLNCQVKLLRVLQDRTFEAVGASHSTTVDIRVVSATNRPLSEMVQKGEFREDLLYRLNLIAVHLPPLRERKGDIPKLAAHFLKHAAKVYRRGKMTLSKASERWLQARPFPGNIRELRHLIERAVIMSPNHVLEPSDFESSLSLEGNSPSEQLSQLPPAGALSLEEMEKAMVMQAVQAHADNLGEAATALGISRYALYRRMEKYGLKAE